ncbi:hypothetical protein [Rhizobium sp. NRK18]|uniref:hypothetical protein n=1 Tax=Rhizobium sp. NRK18 TaxID=2964667 RepID=UPI0021C2EF0E|nr:hypothetical protein [Rhizobium sp. NRK18]MCQ2005258.1 hypothetical protein [Rhizobium sp. NRK18]
MKNSTLERSAPVLTLAFTGVWFGYSLHDAAFPWEPIVVAVGAFIGWLVLDLQLSSHAVAAAQLHPHDKALGNKMRSLFDQPTRRFLKEQNFGQPFKSDLLDKLEILADDWHGTNYEFEDASLDNISAEIVRQAMGFCSRIAEYVGVAGNWPPGHLSVPLDRERAEDQFSDATWAHIKELRTLADSLLGEYERFEKAFRRLAPEEYRKLH